MREIFRTIRDFCKKADMILLALCVAASVFGIVAISSATNFLGGGRYVRTQIIALVLGVICYILLTLIDVDIIAERRELLLLFCTVFIALLFKWGDTQQGNRSWLNFSFLPFSIQPAELCKIPFILILAKIMSVKQNKISAPTTILQIVTIFLFVLIIAASEDLGVALQYIFIFVIMAFVGGVNFVWFLGALGALAAAAPTIWTHLSDDRRNRILVLFDASIDPDAQNERYQVNRSIRALQNGGIRGQGLYHGAEQLPSDAAKRLHLLRHRRRAWDARLPRGAAPALRGHHPHHPRRH